MERLSTVGAPLALGLFNMAAGLSILIYFAVHWPWRMRIVVAWRKRREKRRA
jgi:uncharacterized protein (DUF2062 family)